MSELIKYLAEISCRLKQSDASMLVTSTKLLHENEIIVTERIQRKAPRILA